MLHGRLKLNVPLRQHCWVQGMLIMLLDSDAGSGADEQDGNLLLPPSQLSQDEAARRMAARAPAAGCLDLRNSSTDRPICRFFAKGAHCREGDRCRFVHERSTSPAKVSIQRACA